MILIIIFSVLVILFLGDHILYKNKRLNLLYYKNNHRFSVTVAIRTYHPSLERLFEMAESSEHDFTFININDAVIREDHPTLNIIDMTVSFDPTRLDKRTQLLSSAYSKAYTHMTKDFLLFMDSEIEIRTLKTLDFMANNLVEHQLFTAKETFVYKSITDSHSLFFDFFRDINMNNDMPNYQCFAIKRNTYELARCHEQDFTCTLDFEKGIFKKNITIIHVNHTETLVRADYEKPFTGSVHGFVEYVTHAEQLTGLGRMLLAMLAFHLFYFALVIEFMENMLLALLFYTLVHALFYVAVKPFAKHSPVIFIFTPLLLVWFDLLFFFSLIKRKHHQIKENKIQKNPELQTYDKKQEDWGETAKMMSETAAKKTTPIEVDVELEEAKVDSVEADDTIAETEEDATDLTDDMEEPTKKDTE